MNEDTIKITINNVDDKIINENDSKNVSLPILDDVILKKSRIPFDVTNMNYDQYCAK